jgi:threonine dehydratase
MLLVGIAKVVKAADPSIRVVGVSMRRGAVLIPSLREGQIVDFEEKPTLADAIMGGLGPDGEFILETVKEYMDEGILVSEEEIAEAMSFALHRHHQVVEGAGAVGIAALLSQKASDLGHSVSVVVTGGNVDIQTLCQIAQRRELAWNR